MGPFTKETTEDMLTEGTAEDDVPNDYPEDPAEERLISSSYPFEIEQDSEKASIPSSIIVIAFITISIITLIVFLVFRHQIMGFLENIAIWVRGAGFGGMLLIFGLIFSATFPPMIGYGTFLTLSGFTFGFFKGFLVAYTAALSGGIICFILSRWKLKGYVRTMMRRYASMEAVLLAVEKKGFNLLVLIRIAPYPFAILNVLLSATQISLSTFSLATAISLFKIMLHIWVGANLTTFTESLSGGGPGALKIIVLIFGVIFGTSLMLYIWLLARRAVIEVANEHQPSEVEPRSLFDNVIPV
ncbi:uncharacterized protein VTP21DRAFT_6316 [Calcarisporiella thermophila]|uniref:uncharacterized protein n=1 Tax=Calcarisporiella thermophila TaxID=911321 RepID=UPI003743CD42